ncbi:MAG: Ig-like domain-containing protein [Bacteroidales bacterium]|nr:Ig-like domain-containing protein [Bacteroidales bacterium]
MDKHRLIAALLIITTAICCVVSHSCANTKASPMGGPKDTIPPVIIAVTPPQGDTAFPLVGGTVKIRFDEYTVVKDANQILLSPPHKKKPKTKVKGRDIVVTFQDTLRENTTYTIDFGNGLADNNESNIAPRFVYAFSTCDTLDSMYICGTVVDAESMTPIKNALVSLYREFRDSSCLILLPDAAGRSDDWGFFTIRNIKPVPYWIYATTDENNDYLYNLGEEKVGFCDTAITPHTVVRDSIYELLSFNMKDTLECLARKGQVQLAVFKEFFAAQFIKEKGRKRDKCGYVTFSAPNVEVSSFQILGVDSSDIIMQYSPQRDSFDFWLNTKYPPEDSLFMTISYMKTDSTGALALTTEEIAAAIPKDQVAKAKTEEGRKAAEADTLTDLKITLTDTNVEQDGITLEFSVPVIEMHLDSIVLLSTNTRNQTDTTAFTFTQDTTNIMRFVLQNTEAYKPGYKYSLNIPEATFFDVYGRKNKREQKDFQLPNTENLNSLMLNITGTNGRRFIVDLTDDKCKKVFRKYEVLKDGEYFFPYIADGKYSIRITEDRNHNGLFDTGNLLKWQQPEPMKLFKLPDGTSVFGIQEQMEIYQDIDLTNLFEQ